MVNAFLVDANVLVYAYDPTDGRKRERAISILDHLSATQLGVLSVQVLGEFFVTVTRKIPSPLTPNQAERSVTNYIRSWPVFDLTPLIVLEALRGVQRHKISYWDSLIWATARLNQVPYVLTEDLDDGALLEGVRFLNPFSASFDLALLTPGR
ncbi:MAG TPA: PIN domain-containing protein [Dehalococcoidia bacterium]|nr:PIN domain-containing protein [Dehalococcoidia bacterium]